MYGAELAGTLPFDIFSPALDGFGITGGAGYTKTHITDFNGNPSSIPGYSKWVANLTAFYEKSGFSIRGSMRYRSGFIGDFVLVQRRSRSSVRACGNGVRRAGRLRLPARTPRSPASRSSSRLRTSQTNGRQHRVPESSRILG